MKHVHVLLIDACLFSVSYTRATYSGPWLELH